MGHHVGDVNRESIIAQRMKSSNGARSVTLAQILASWLIEQGLAEAAIFQQIEASVQSEVSAAVEFALNAPYPAVEEVDSHVFA
ncbi:MAG: hypothetical protein R2932_06405 [Caldilineaceae bacterium]